MNSEQQQNLIEKVTAAVKGLLADAQAEIAALTEKVNTLETELAAIPEGKAGPAGATGAPGSEGAPGDQGRDGRDGKDGRNGRDGIDGQDGKDASDLVILSEFDPARNYHKGTLARHQGGLFRCNGYKDWECLVVGVNAITKTMSEDGTELSLVVQMSDGQTTVHKIGTPGIQYKGVWKTESEYMPGDCVTHDGSMWIAKQATAGKPGQYAKEWQLCVKKGRNGK